MELERIVSGDAAQGGAVMAPDRNPRTDAHGRVWVRSGDVVTLKVAYSEVCAYMGVADQIMQVRLTTGEYPMAQLIRDGRDFSSPILPSEAGLYGCASEGYYTYPVDWSE